jgi:hypothetical protein
MPSVIDTGPADGSADAEVGGAGVIGIGEPDAGDAEASAPWGVVDGTGATCSANWAGLV